MEINLRPALRRKELFLGLAACLLAGGLVACQVRTPAPPPVAEIVAQSVTRMKGMAGFHFIIDRQGAPAFVDMGNTIAFRRTDGDFVAPDRTQATVRVIAPGIVADLKIISLGDDYWETNLVSGEWQHLPAGTGFNPAILFDPQVGLQSILETDLNALNLEGMEELDEVPGKKLYAITGQLLGGKLYQMSYGMIGPDQVQVKMWIAPASYDLYRVFITEPANSSRLERTWQVDFYNFGQAADIQPPKNAIELNP